MSTNRFISDYIKISKTLFNLFLLQTLSLCVCITLVEYRPRCMWFMHTKHFINYAKFSISMCVYMVCISDSVSSKPWKSNIIVIRLYQWSFFFRPIKKEKNQWNITNIGNEISSNLEILPWICIEISFELQINWQKRGESTYIDLVDWLIFCAENQTRSLNGVHISWISLNHAYGQLSNATAYW